MKAATVLIALLIAGCGGGSSGSSTTHYQLGAGSEVRISNAGDGSSKVEPLSGTFETAPPRGYRVPGVGFSVAIVQLHFKSPSIEAEGIVTDGAIGGIDDSDISVQTPIGMAVTVSLNGQPAYLSGKNFQDSLSGNPPALRGVRIRGGDYEITLFAEPEH
jgi:hypothetical protein